MKDLKIELKGFYESRGILETPLVYDCPHADSCWNSFEDSTKEKSKWKIYAPYIGQFYNRGRILTIGINMHQYGDTDAQDGLSKLAINEIMQGKKRTFSNPNYRGTLLWHRLLLYSAIILRENGTITIPHDRQQPNKEDLSITLDYIAATNSIKCSPHTKNSVPSPQMWGNCPSFILFEEINILKPKYLIVFGIQNYKRLQLLYKHQDEAINGQVRFCKFQNGNDTIAVYGFPHTSSSRGTSTKRINELEQLVIEHKM